MAARMLLIEKITFTNLCSVHKPIFFKASSNQFTSTLTGYAPIFKKPDDRYAKIFKYITLYIHASKNMYIWTAGFCVA